MPEATFPELGLYFKTLPLNAERQFAVAYVDPPQTLFDQFFVYENTFNLNKCHCPAVAVCCDGFDLYDFSEYQLRGKLLCSVAERLSFLRAIYSVQPDLLRLFVTKNSYGISVTDADYLVRIFRE